MVTALALVLASSAWTQPGEKLPEGVLARLSPTDLRFPWDLKPLHYSADGSVLLHVQRNRHITRIELPSKKTVDWLPSVSMWGGGALPTCSVDGNHVYTLAPDLHGQGNLEIVDTRTGKRSVKSLEVFQNEPGNTLVILPKGPTLIRQSYNNNPPNTARWCAFDAGTSKLRYGQGTLVLFPSDSSYSKDCRYVCLAAVGNPSENPESKATFQVLDVESMTIAADYQFPLAKLGYREYTEEDGSGGGGRAYSTRTFFSADAETLFLSVDYYAPLAWKWKTEKTPTPLFKEPDAHSYRIFATSPDSNRFLILPVVQPAFVYDLATKKKFERKPSLPFGVFTPDGKGLSGFLDTALVTVDIESGRIIEPSATPPFGRRPLRFSDSAKTLWVSAEKDHEAELDWRTGKQLQMKPSRPDLHRMVADDQKTLSSYEGSTPDLQRYLYTVDDGKIRAYAGEVSAPKGTAKPLPVVADKHLHANFAAEGKEIITLKDWRVLQRWRTCDFHRLAVTTLEGGHHRVLARSSRGDTALMAVGPNRNETAEIYFLDFLSGKKSTLGSGLGFRLWNNLFTPDDERTVFVKTDETENGRTSLVLFDRKLGRPLFTHPWKDRSTIAQVAPNGRFAITYAFSNPEIIELITGQVRLAEPSRNQNHAFSIFAPNSRFRASSGDRVPLDIYDCYRAETHAKDEAEWADAERDAMWKTLAHGDAKSAFPILGRMIRNPRLALSLIDARLPAVRKPESAKIRTWLTNLASLEFNRRDLAMKELTKVGDMVEPDLRAELARNVELEVRRRIEKILDLATEVTPERVLHWRVLEVLEAIGPALGGPTLDRILRGDPNAWLTREASLVKLHWDRLGKEP